MVETTRNPGASVASLLLSQSTASWGSPTLGTLLSNTLNVQVRKLRQGHCWDSHLGSQVTGWVCIGSGAWGGRWHFDEPETTGQGNAVERGVTVGNSNLGFKHLSKDGG